MHSHNLLALNTTRTHSVRIERVLRGAQCHASRQRVSAGHNAAHLPYAQTLDSRTHTHTHTHSYTYMQRATSSFLRFLRLCCETPPRTSLSGLIDTHTNMFCHTQPHTFSFMQVHA